MSKYVKCQWCEKEIPERECDEDSQYLNDIAEYIETETNGLYELDHGDAKRMREIAAKLAGDA